MARFNTQTTTRYSERAKTVNLAGGEAYSQSAELEFISLLLTTFVKKSFYRGADETIAKCQELLKRVNPQFAAKAAIYARTQFGMRSISHVVAGELCKMVSNTVLPELKKIKKDLARAKKNDDQRLIKQLGREQYALESSWNWFPKFLNAVVYRPDDIMEITSYYFGDDKTQKETGAMRTGLGAALSRFDEYSLAKYRGEGKGISLVDCVNLYHPKHTPALEKLVKGTLKNVDTWEARLSGAGQEVQGIADKKFKEEKLLELKGDAWNEMLESGKLGYFALLRNLRNIIEQAPKALPLALEQLRDEKQIKKSLVLPFRFMTAQQEISQLPGMPARKTMQAISDAIDISLDNIPELDGRTLIAIDESGSMAGAERFDIAALFGAALYRKLDADIIMFNGDARYVTLSPSDSVMSICTQLKNMFRSGSTNFKSIFELMTVKKAKYDRIVILSDMQSWVGYDTPKTVFANYKRKLGVDPHVYSIDLAGHGTMQFPEKRVCALAGWSEKIFDLMGKLEQDPQILVNTIHQIEFVPPSRGKKLKEEVEE